MPTLRPLRPNVSLDTLSRFNPTRGSWQGKRGPTANQQVGGTVEQGRQTVLRGVQLARNHVDKFLRGIGL